MTFSPVVVFFFWHSSIFSYLDIIFAQSKNDKNHLLGSETLYYAHLHLSLFIYLILGLY